MTSQADATLRKILDESPIGAAVFDRATTNRLYVNSTLAKMFGVATGDELTRMEVSESWVNQEELKRAFSVFQSGQNLINFEAERKRKDGSRWWVLMNTQPVEFEGRDASIIWHIDITERKHADHYRHESERRLLHAFEDGPVGMVLTTPQGTRFKVNKALANFLGYTVEELTNTDLQSTSADQIALDHSMRLRQQVIDGEISTFHHEQSYYHKNGHIVWGEVTGSLFRNDADEPEYFVAHIVDITERKAVSERSERLRTAINQLSEGVVIFDKDDRVVIANDAWKELNKAIPEHSCPGTRFEDHLRAASKAGLIPKSAGREEAWLAERMERHNNPTGPFMLARQDGRWVQIHEQHLIDGGTILIISDITELKQIEAQLLASKDNAETARQETEQRFQSVVDNTPTSVHLKDTAGRFLVVNKTFEKWYGLSMENVVGKTSQELFDPQFGNAFIDQDKEVLESGQVRERELLAQFADGKIHPIYNIKFPVFDDDQEVVGIGTIATDLTEFNLLGDQLRSAQRMEAVGQLTGGIAHDFNNLLSVMIGNAEILEHRISNDEAATHSLEAIIKAADRGASLTQRLLAFSRQQTLLPKPTAINGLIVGLEDMLKRTLGETVEFSARLGPGNCNALIDPHQFENALINLSINAMDAMPDGGTLTIETANVSLDQTDLKQYAEIAAGDYVKVSVSDTGAGMSPEVLEKVFEPFFTTKDVGQGSGLGLSMVYGFIKQSTGHVTIESEPGRGTTISLYLPQTDDIAVQEVARSQTKELARGSERILLVEDDKGVREISTAILRSQGYQVVEAGDGKEAIGLMNAEQPFDLLFTDVVLPGGMDGVEIAQQAERAQPGIKVLFTSGYAENSLAHEGKLKPGITLISKPYRLAQLLDQIRAVLDSE